MVTERDNAHRKHQALLSFTYRKEAHEITALVDQAHKRSPSAHKLMNRMVVDFAQTLDGAGVEESGTRKGKCKGR